MSVPIFPVPIFLSQDMEPAPWTLIGPAVTMMVTLFCLNFIGDGLRDAIDPKDR